MRRDLVIAACAAAGAVGYLIATWNLQTVPIGDPLGPRAYPAMLGVGLLVAAAMIFFEARRAAAGSNEAPSTPLLPSRKVLGAIVGTMVFILLFEPLGFLLASALYLFAMMTVFHPGHLATNSAVALGFTLAAYVLFNHLLGVSLPGGLVSF